MIYFILLYYVTNLLSGDVSSLFSLYITRPTLKKQENDQTALKKLNKIHINLPKQTQRAIFTAITTKHTKKIQNQQIT